MTALADVRELAESLLAESLPERWVHVRAVAELAEGMREVPGVDGDGLVRAALLHDIGYAKDLDGTGFHPLDGARYLRTAGVDDRVCALVAHHSAAVYEARLRGLGDVLSAEFEDERSVTRDALWYCDMTIGPTGRRMTLAQRLAEIRGRYGVDHIVNRFADQAKHELAAAVARTEERMRAIS
jgi:putative nucleotidyltransferase with HDIG domain